MLINALLGNFKDEFSCISFNILSKKINPNYIFFSLFIWEIRSCKMYCTVCFCNKLHVKILLSFGFSIADLSGFLCLFSVTQLAWNICFILTLFYDKCHKIFYFNNKCITFKSFLYTYKDNIVTRDEYIIIYIYIFIFIVV